MTESVATLPKVWKIH